MKEMIFWGATGQAKVLEECLKDEDLELVALFDNNKNLISPFENIPLYFAECGFREWFKKQSSDCSIKFLVAIGGDKGKDRVEIQNFLQSFGLIPLIAKHPTAFIASNVQLGYGSQILAHATVCVEATLGQGCIINTGAIVDHECHLEEGVHVCPGAHLAGCVKVGRFSTIGTGAVVLPKVKIGESVIVGAGAVVLKDIPSHTVVAGNPARILKRLTK